VIWRNICSPKNLGGLEVFSSNLFFCKSH
jgi:hypothetical protein